MRIIAGTKRGVKLISPPGEDMTRPTLDRIKEALFGSIQFGLMGTRVLDLFAGSGALGLEALSRGAAFCQFVDYSQDAVRCIGSNIKAAGFGEYTSVMKCDYLSAINRLSKVPQVFDFVFLDPPYESGYYNSAALMLSEHKLIDEKSVIIAEHDTKAEVKFIPGFLVYKRKKYGKTMLSYLKKGE